MTRINPISIMQSRIAKRKRIITEHLAFYHTCCKQGLNCSVILNDIKERGLQQKQDRAILRRLVELERGNVLLAQMFQQVVNYADVLQLRLDMKNDE